MSRWMTSRSCAYWSALATALAMWIASSTSSWRSRSSPRAKRLPFDVRHHVVEERVRFTRVEERQDVRVLKRRRGLDFADEALGTDDRSELRPQHLHGLCARASDRRRDTLLACHPRPTPRPSHSGQRARRAGARRSIRSCAHSGTPEARSHAALLTIAFRRPSR